MHPEIPIVKMNTEKDFLKTANYQTVKSCSNHLYIVGKPLCEGKAFNKYGVVDDRDNIIIPFSYISIIEECGQFFRVRRLTDDKTAILDTKGNIIIDYGQYVFWWSFWGNYIKVKQNGCYGLLDTGFNVALPCQYSNMFSCLDGEYSNCYGVKRSKDDGWTFLDNRTLRPRF